MIISGAWALNQLPNHYVLEIPTVGLRMAYITPFRVLTEQDLTPYKGYHPRRINGIPMPEYMYRFYGLEKSDETASEVLRMRVTPTDKLNIERKAKEAGLNVSEYLRQAAINHTIEPEQ